MTHHFEIKQIRRLLLLFMLCLFLSGLTAIPIHFELSILQQFFFTSSWVGYWINEVHIAYNDVNTRYPFLLYGYDWLAFAHFILAILFIGPYRDPIRNVWVIQFGLIACILIFPFAFLAGSARGIPIGWRLIDCSFGVFGFLLLYKIMIRIIRLEDAGFKPSSALPA